MEIEFKVLRPNFFKDTSPTLYATAGSAGLDLRAAIENTIKLEPGQTELINTGIAINIANKNYMAIILPRSGLGHKGLVLGNLVGLIDSDYQGEIKVSCWNRSKEEKIISPGDRIAQLVVTPVIQPKWSIVDEFSNTSERGSGGFGHTGTN